MNLSRKKTFLKTGQDATPKTIYLCPTSDEMECIWEGECSDLIRHFEERHGDLLLRSSSFVADISRSNSKNLILHVQKNVFLLQTEFIKDEFKLLIRLRFLGSQEHANKIKYSVEVFSGNFSFTNKHTQTGYNPVSNLSSGSVEVDVQGIMLICGRYNFAKLNCSVHITDEWKENNEITHDLTDDDDDEFGSMYSNILNEAINDYEFLQNDKFLERPKSKDLSSLFQVDDSKHNYSELITNNNTEIKKDQQSNNSDDVYEEVENESNENLSTEEKLSLLKCSNCSMYMIPPIFLCLNGHNVCNNCRLFDCKICLDFVTKNRNHTLESWAKTVDFPCRYFKSGCFVNLSYTKIQKHESNCSFCPYTCNVCNFEGQMMEMRSHFKIHHPSMKIFDAAENLPFPNGSNFFVIDQGGIFHCTSMLFESLIEWKVVFCGSPDRQFSCEVNVFGKRNSNHQTYFLEREENVYRMSVSLDVLKSAGVKIKNASLRITNYY